MCSNLDTDIPEAFSKIKLDLLRFCKRCQGKPFVVLQRKDVFCRECFYEYCSHKFRSTIGKSRKLKPGDRVLVAFSGGSSSSAMLDMIEEGLHKPNDHKKLLFSPTILFIKDLNYIDQDDELKKQKIIERLKQSSLPTLISSMEMFYQDKNEPIYVSLEDFISSEKNCPINCKVKQSKLWTKIDSILTDTGKEDFLRILKHQLLQKIATIGNFKYIFLGNTCTKTAIQMLTDLAQGKGSQITSEHSFSDSRSNIEVLKPMREFIKKEVIFWNILRGIEPIEWPTLTTSKGNKSSLLKLTESYLYGLEHDFPATVYTIFKTGNKLKVPDTDGIKCKICKFLIDPELKCSASNALRLSHQFSKNSSNGNSDNNKSLCYSCKNLVNEIKFEASASPEALGIEEYLLDSSASNEN